MSNIGNEELQTPIDHVVIGVGILWFTERNIGMLECDTLQDLLDAKVLLNDLLQETKDALKIVDSALVECGGKSGNSWKVDGWKITVTDFAKKSRNFSVKKAKEIFDDLVVQRIISRQKVTSLTSTIPVRQHVRMTSTRNAIK